MPAYRLIIPLAARRAGVAAPSVLIADITTTDQPRLLSSVSACVSPRSTRVPTSSPRVSSSSAHLSSSSPCISLSSAHISSISPHVSAISTRFLASKAAAQGPTPPGGRELSHLRHPADPTVCSPNTCEILFLNGFNSNMQNTKSKFIRAHSIKRGWGVTTFDYRGHGASPGRPGKGTISEWLEDTCHVIDNIIPPTSRIVIVGYSMGGWMMVLAALLRPERIAGCVGIAPAPDFIQEVIWKGLTDEDKAKLARDGEIYIPTPYDSPYDAGYLITSELVDDAQRHSILNHTESVGISGAALDVNTRALKIPMRFLHGTNDVDIPYGYSQKLVEVLCDGDALISGEDIRLELIQGGNHRLSTAADLARIASAIDEVQSAVSGERGLRLA